MKVYLPTTVLDAAKERIERIYREFPTVVVGFSGGKDSTVLFHLALEVARKLDRLPLPVLWLDQEAEWQATVEAVERVMTHPDVQPFWLQVPIRLFNATSPNEPWLHCWSEAERDRWMRDRHPLALTENVYGTDRFHEMFAAVFKHHFGKQPAAYLAGVRTEESPARFVALTHNATYKGITWGKVLDRKRNHYTFYPLYDWSYTDVWKAIHEHAWPYNRIYDEQFRYGIKVKDMRVSNLHHETAVHALFYMQEVEPDTHARLTQRIGGIDAATKFGKDDFFVTDLPFAFASWREYRDYLLEHLVSNPDWRANLRNHFDRMDPLYSDALGDLYYRMCIQSVLTNDWEGIKLENFERRPDVYVIRKRLQGREVY